MTRGVGKRHRPSQVVEKLGDGDAMLNAGKTVSEVVQHRADLLSLAEPVRWYEVRGSETWIV